MINLVLCSLELLYCKHKPWCWDYYLLNVRSYCYKTVDAAAQTEIGESFGKRLSHRKILGRSYCYYSFREYCATL